jgi:endonuclease YncB( thermonuclease family)
MLERFILLVLMSFSAAGLSYSQVINVADRRLPMIVVAQSSQIDNNVRLIEGNAVMIFGGDTISVAGSDRSSYTIRLRGISAPAYKQSYGPESARKLGYLVQGMNVAVIVNRVDSDGHYVGSVLLDGQDVSLAQIRNGMAWSRDKYDSDLTPVERDIYAGAEQKARADGIGLWADSNPIPPWVFKGEKMPPIEDVTSASNESKPQATSPAPTGSLVPSTSPRPVGSPSKTTSERKYILGPRGGCYYLNSQGIKVYVRNKALCGGK